MQVLRGAVGAFLLITAFAVLPTVYVFGDSATTTVTIFVPQCSDGIDNDGDGLIDFPADPGCDDAFDNDETDVVFECSDGIDNDGDGLIDFPADPGCDDAFDNDETDPPGDDDGGGGGGGGGRRIPPEASIQFFGLSHSLGDVLILRDGVLIATVQAGTDARFSFSIDDVTPGEYLFTFYGIDTLGRKSGLLSFTVNVPKAQIVLVENIFIPPTLSAVEETVHTVFLRGSAPPLARVFFALFDVGIPLGEEETSADSLGLFQDAVAFDSSRLVVKAKALVNGLESPYGVATRVEGGVPVSVDLNGDGKVNLVDFSILAYWYKRENPPNQFDLNSDGVVDLTDVSILAFYWTG